MDGCGLEKTNCVRCMRYATCENKGNPELLCTHFVPNCGKEDRSFENMTLGLGMLFKAMEKGAKVVEVTKAGVVQFPDDLVSFAVNSENILMEVERKVMEKKPVVDSYGKFAGRVTVRVEILGDLQNDTEERTK